MIKLNRTRFAFRLDSSQQFNTVSTLWRVEHTRVADSEMFWIKENFSTFWKPCRSKNHSFYSNSKKVNFLLKNIWKFKTKLVCLIHHLFTYFHYFMKFPMNDHTICLPLKLQIEKPQSSYYYYVLWTHTSKQSFFFLKRIRLTINVHSVHVKTLTSYILVVHSLYSFYLYIIIIV